MKTVYSVDDKEEDWRFERVKLAGKTRSSSAASKNPNPVMAWPLIRTTCIVSLHTYGDYGRLDFGYVLTSMGLVERSYLCELDLKALSCMQLYR